MEWVRPRVPSFGRWLHPSMQPWLSPRPGCARRKRNLRGLGAGRTERSGGATTLLIALAPRRGATPLSIRPRPRPHDEREGSSPAWAETASRRFRDLRGSVSASLHCQRRGRHAAILRVLPMYDVQCENPHVGAAFIMNCLGGESLPLRPSL